LTAFGTFQIADVPRALLLDEERDHSGISLSAVLAVRLCFMHFVWYGILSCARQILASPSKTTPVEYNCDTECHLTKRDAESGKPISNRKKDRAAVLRVQNSNATTPGEGSPHRPSEGINHISSGGRQSAITCFEYIGRFGAGPRSESQAQWNKPCCPQLLYIIGIWHQTRPPTGWPRQTNV